MLIINNITGLSKENTDEMLYHIMTLYHDTQHYIKDIDEYNKNIDKANEFFRLVYYLDNTKGMEKNINEINRYGINALQAAIMSGFADIVSTLIYTYNVDVECYGNLGLNPIHLAVMSKNLEIAKLLFDAGAATCYPISLKFCDIRSIHLAVMSGNIEMVKFLVENSANTSQSFYMIRDSEGSVFDIANILDYKDIIDYFISKKITKKIIKDDDITTIDCLKNLNNDIQEINKIILNLIPDILEMLNFKDKLLIKTIKKNDVLSMKFLLENGANPNTITYEKDKEYEYLLDNYHNNNHYNDFYFNNFINKPPRRRTLRYSWNKFYSKKESPLIYHAIRSGNIEIVKALVEAGTKINFKKDKEEETPLDYAYEKNIPIIIKYLEEKGTRKSMESFVLPISYKLQILQPILDSTTSSNKEMTELIHKNEQNGPSFGDN